jgi:hypothetical protein
MKLVPRVLLACTSAGALVLARLLGADADLIPVLSLDEALSALGQHVDLVVCMTQFDDSRMFELLRIVHERFASVPFVACDLGCGSLGAQTLKAVEAAALIVGARAFIDWRSMDHLYGVRAPERFRAMLGGILASADSRRSPVSQLEGGR